MSGIRQVLLIEDDPDLRDELSAILIFKGYMVQSAGDGEEGLHKLKETRPDLVICDYNMPEINGGEVLRTIRGDPQNDHIPFILMSGSNPPENLDQFDHNFLAKPIQLDKLLTLIKNYTSKME